ncbi:maternal effect embryo arrest protein [Rhynchospora pubera]|uniref:Maternal effect embryo arrest protein n=1 Tax=Rhynchospora pubera TaxID=906938 RepID=A0AAV8DJS1_9POAL|nr:maternal effect embryo arrest protein [Rhynchospora pubera]
MADNGGGTSISITALDGIVNVNSLFTLASFLGLAWTPSNGSTALSDPECAAGDRAESDLVSFHVLAFACFLFSSLVALCLKQAIRTVPRPGRASIARINRLALRGGIIACATSSVFACFFLMLALVNLVQVRLGRISCSGAALRAAVPLVTLVPAGLFIYAAIVLYTFAHTH